MKLYSQAWFNHYYKNRTWQTYNGTVKILKPYLTEPILDIGCGLGFSIEAFIRAGYRARGIDNSSAALKLAKSRNPSLKLIQADLRKTWPVKTESIGTLICSQTIEHLPEHKQEFLIKESYRVLKPNGILWIDTPSWWNKEERQETSHKHLFTPKELAKLLRANRFQIIQSLCASRNWAKILYFYTKWGVLSQTASFICQKND
jgi:SAM-dependent methyltransferase